jgi:tRNA (mo5U34)-methyltransferase
MSAAEKLHDNAPTPPGLRYAPPPHPDDRDELRRRVHSRAWFHRIDLGRGLITPGIDNTPDKLRRVRLPRRLRGLSVLDIGAYDGFFSFECERRGAARVVAADHYCWTYGGMASKEGFELARAALRSRVEDVLLPVEDLSPAAAGTFDLVLFLGVLYHAPDPLLYLRNARSVCRGRLILETHIDALDYPQPAAVFYPSTALNNDASNFWGPNPAAVEAMLRECGFRRIKQICIYNRTRAVYHAFV